MSLLVVGFTFMLVVLFLYFLVDIFYIDRNKYKKLLHKFNKWLESFVKESDWSNPNITNEGKGSK